MRDTPKPPLGLPQKKEMAVSTRPVLQQRISLNELKQQPQQSEEDSMRSSNTFQREKDKQKQNNREVFDLLKSVRLESYYDSFIEMGYDDRQSLTEVGTDVLNCMRMKASHQRLLLEEVKRKVGSSMSVGTEFDDPEITRSYISSRNRIHTEPQLPTGRLISQTQTSTVINTNQRPKPKPISLLATSKSSFLYSAGGSEFSLLPSTSDSQMPVRQRKACCYCFKITLEPIASGYFFYCSKQCVANDTKKSRKRSPGKPTQTFSERPLTNFPLSEADPLDFQLSRLSLSNSMVRQYD